MNSAPVNAPPVTSKPDSPSESPMQSPEAQPNVSSASAKPRRLDALGRLQCYMLAALCSALIWVGLVASDRSWLKWAALFAGLVGLAALCVCIVRWRLE